MNNLDLDIKEDIVFILIKNKPIILNNWCNLIKNNFKFIDNTFLNFSTLATEKLFDNFINFLKHGYTDSYQHINLVLAREIVYHDIKYKNLTKAVQYFEESYIPIFIKEVKLESLNNYIITISKNYHKTIASISEEYFNLKDTTVIALVKLAELRDDTTGNHLERTREYSLLLCEELNLEDTFIRNMDMASSLHDIGKVGIKDEILLKPGKLTQYEFEEMKLHTIIGAETIDQIIKSTNPVKEYLLMARDIALYHHEKYNGSGYPFKLLKNKIPLSARIFALADAYDVIVSKRPYKKALSHCDAVRRITSDSGNHFDPEVVKAFLRIQEKFQKINYIHHQTDSEPKETMLNL